MLNKLLVAAIALVSLGGMMNVQAQETVGQYASINGLEMYYEIHGEGEPLLLLHGGLGGIVEFAQLLPQLAQTRQVIAVEMQGHGHTADIDRPMSYEALADDVAALIAHLGLEQADVLGYSLGGGVALRTAIQHPEVVRKLILISTTYSTAGLHPEFYAGMTSVTAETASAMLETPMYQFYASVAPQPEDWATFAGKVGDMLRPEYDWSEEVKSVTAPTLIVVGDSDMLTPTHAVELFKLLGGGVAGGLGPMPVSQLNILPATNHFTILSNPALPSAITTFLDTSAAVNG